MLSITRYENLTALFRCIWAPIVPILLLGLLTPTPASAYCAAKAHAHTDWKDNVILGTFSPIPVYANWSDPTVGLNQLEHVDVSFDQTSMEVYLRAAIAQINDAATGKRTPTLYFAGWLTANTGQAVNRPARSIVVHGDSSPCSGTGIACSTSGNSNKWEVQLHNGGVTWTVNPSSNPNEPDVQGTLAHEFAHALGLKHANQAEDPPNDDECEVGTAGGPGGVAVNNAMMSISGAVNSTHSLAWYRLRRRTLQMDDLQGLRHIYNSSPFTPQFYESDDGVSWSSVSGPAGITSWGAVGLSTSSGIDSEVTVAAWADVDDEIAWAVREYDGTWSAPFTCSVPTQCVTFHTPAAAVIDNGTTNAYMVAWTADDNYDDSDSTLRWNIVDHDTGTVLDAGSHSWSGWFGDHYTRSFALGANPHQEEFIVASMGPWNLLTLTSFDLDGNLVDSEVFVNIADLSGFPHQLGTPVCTEYLGHDTMKCAIPLVSNEIDGTCQGYVEFQHGPRGFSVIDYDSDCDVQIPGRMTLAAEFPNVGEPSCMITGGTLVEDETDDLQGLWHVDSVYGVLDGDHDVGTDPGPVDRHRSLGSQTQLGATVWLMADLERL